MSSTTMLIAAAATLLAATPAQTSGSRSGAVPQPGPTIAAQPIESPTRFTATATFSDGAARVFAVTADRDSDNDGVNDQMELRVTCSGGTVASSSIAPRDSASGLATGRRTHGPAVKSSGGHPEAMDDWTRRVVGKPIAASWDLATAKGARSAAGAAPVPITLVDVDPAVCAAR